MTAHRVIWTVTIILACGLASYWLFKDTVRHYGIGKETPPLRISFWGDVAPYQMWQEMLASFRQRHPQVAVQAEYITDRYADKIQQLPVAGAEPQRHAAPGCEAQPIIEVEIPMIRRRSGDELPIASCSFPM